MGLRFRLAAIDFRLGEIVNLSSRLSTRLSAITVENQEE
jgi:hypothetical protein